MRHIIHKFLSHVEGMDVDVLHVLRGALCEVLGNRVNDRVWAFGEIEAELTAFLLRHRMVFPLSSLNFFPVLHVNPQVMYIVGKHSVPELHATIKVWDTLSVSLHFY